MKCKIKRNDTVKVLAGKEKGKTGKVRKVVPEKGQVIVEGLNMVTKHVKATSEGPGRKFKKEAPLHISNVAFWDVEAQSIVKIGFKNEIDENGKRRSVRVNKKTQQPLD
jgi:large subunit ribosomal protein L24